MTKYKYILAIAALIILGESPLMAQFKQIKTSPSTGETFQLKPLSIPTAQEIPADKKISLHFESMGLSAFEEIETRIYAKAYDEGLPIFFRGNLKAQKGKSIEEQIAMYVDHINKYYKLPNIESQYVVGRKEIDNNDGRIHIQQVRNGVKVEGGEWYLHLRDGIITIANGRFVAQPNIETSATISTEKAIDIVLNDYMRQGIYQEIKPEHAFLVPDITKSAELMIIRENEEYILAYKVDAYANIAKRYVYYIDAKSGEIIHNYKNFCSLHNHADDHVRELIPDGTTATAKDLKNIDRLINVYEEGGTYYMIDDSRSMHNSAASSASNFPHEPVSVIWTIDAGNTNPENSNFAYDHVSSSNNTWSSKTAVSAHYNGGEAFEYFRNTHNRNSINGEGGNIISLINISDTDGSGFDNAFWNGQAMFYGNGNTAFSPLAEALDVAGHEMSHGVVQATANLTYQGESGAMNEAFADIFGAMMDREDWFIGEEIAKTAVFPTGRMRDMSNPHNGGSQLGDNGWQPNHVNEQYFGSQDNGGVHINSGIVNFAFFKFASNGSVGKDKAEVIFYHALTTYLSKSSNFKDLRAAVEQSCDDKGFSNIKSIASQAFADVGIGTGGGNTDYETDVEMNPGEDFLLHSDNNLSNLILKNNSLQDISNPLSDINHISRPSVTDNGQFIFFVGQDNNIYYLTIDWELGEVSSTLFDDQGLWRNVIISKDGTRLAAITDQTNNQIIVVDFTSGAQKTFTLYNPTFTEGVSTGNVDFADAMEFDFTGEYIMYDAQSTINGNGGSITYWDIGFLEVFNNDNNSFANGDIQKLFNQLPENVSVGNPTFSKNSPHIIAFDFIEGSNYKIMGANIESSDLRDIFENGGLGYPSYNNADNQLVYQFEWLFGVDIGLMAMESDKITPQFDGDAIIVESARFPVVFSNGDRVIISTKNEELGNQVTVFPNPVQNEITIETPENWKIDSWNIYDSKGASIDAGNRSENTFQIASKDWNSGMYFIVLNTNEGQVVKRIVKE